MNGHDTSIHESDLHLLEGVAALAGQVLALSERGADVYRPIVEDLIQSGSSDINQMEWTLDGLLDFCHHPAALELYRRLCRHLWSINQCAAVAYVQHYRDRYQETAVNEGGETRPVQDAQPAGECQREIHP